MPEPTTAAAATLASSAATVTALTAFGIPLGLQPEQLIAGFGGSLAAIVLLNSVPGTGDTWQQLLRTTGRRIAVSLASSLTAGYLTPMVAAGANLREPFAAGVAFVVGACAQQVLRKAISRWAAKEGS